MDATSTTNIFGSRRVSPLTSQSPDISRKRKAEDYESSGPEGKRKKKRTRKAHKRKTPVSQAPVASSSRVRIEDLVSPTNKANSNSSSATITGRPRRNNTASPHSPASPKPLEMALVSLSPSNISKGKGKSTDSGILSSSAQSPASAALADEKDDEITRLRAELKAKDELLSSKSDLINNLQQYLTCEVCIGLLVRPYVTPCGHVSCYSCLLQWFKRPNPDDDAVPIHARVKSCPHCRAAVKSPPVAVWSVKNMSEAILQSNAVPKPDINVGQDEPCNDPWKGVFSPDAGGSNNGSLPTGFYDDEDGGVWRCLDDLHEIWNGVCTLCGRVYRVPHEPNGDDLDLENLGRIHALNNMLFDGHNLWGHLSDLSDDAEDDDDIENVASNHIPMFPTPRRLRQPAHRLLHGMPFHDENEEDEEGMDTDDDDWRDRIRAWTTGSRRWRMLEDDNMAAGSEDEEDEDEDASYEGSFIDDGDDGGDDQGHDHGNNHPWTPAVNLTTDSDLDEPDWNRTARRLGAHARPVVLSDVETDLSSPVGRPNPGSTQPNNPVVMISDEEDQEDIEEAVVPRRSGRQRIPFSSSELSEDEIIIDQEGPARPRPPVRMPSIQLDDDAEDAESSLASRVAQREQALYGDDGSVSRIRPRGDLIFDEDEDEENIDDNDEGDEEDVDIHAVANFSRRRSSRIVSDEENEEDSESGISYHNEEDDEEVYAF